MNGFGPLSLFVAVALIFGSLFVLLVPPFQSPDEPNHFLRAYQVSEGRFFPEKINDQRLGGTLPQSLQLLADSFAYLKNDYQARLQPGLIRQALAWPLQPEHRKFLDFANTAVYAPTAYVPQAIAIALLRACGAGPLLMLYAARFFNLFVWIGLVRAALRRLPALHRPVAGLALLPAALVIAASANADVLTNALCFWLFAAFCQPVLRKKVAQVLAFACVCIAKLVVLPLGLLYVVFPKNRRFFVVLLCAGAIAAISWGQLAQNWFIPYDAYDPAYRHTQTLNEGVQPAAQLHFVADQPVFFINTVFRSYAAALPSTLAHFVGKFGWEKNYLPAGWLAGLWLALGGLVSCEAYSWQFRQRGLALCSAGLFVALFSVTMYALWCPVGAAELSNLQGRYFVPIGPVLVLALSNGWGLRAERFVVPAAWSVLVLGNIAMVWAMWGRW